MNAMPVTWSWTFPTETPASRAMFDGIRGWRGLQRESEYAAQRYRDTGEFRWLKRAVKLAFLSGWRQYARPEGPLRLRGLYR